MENQVEKSMGRGLEPGSCYAPGPPESGLFRADWVFSEVN